MGNRPVVVGSGPAGLLAAYYLAAKGYRPLIIERGQAVKERVPANRRFDRGGGFEQETTTCSAKAVPVVLVMGNWTCRITGSDVDWVLDRFVECGGRESMVYENRPHLGSNKLPMICRNFRRKIEAMGGEYKFDCSMEDVETNNESITAINTSSGTITRRTWSSLSVTARGHVSDAARPRPAD